MGRVPDRARRAGGCVRRCPRCCRPAPATRSASSCCGRSTSRPVCCPGAGRRRWWAPARGGGRLARVGRAAIVARRPAAVRGHAPGPPHRDRPAPPAGDGAAAAAAVGPAAGAGHRSAAGVHAGAAGRAPLPRRPRRAAARAGRRRRALPAGDVVRHDPAVHRAGLALFVAGLDAASPSPRRSTTPAGAMRRPSTPARSTSGTCPSACSASSSSLPWPSGSPGCPAGRDPRRRGRRRAPPARPRWPRGALVSVLSGRAQHDAVVAGPAGGAGHAPGVPHRVAARARDRRGAPDAVRPRPDPGRPLRSGGRGPARSWPLVAFVLVCGWVRLRDEIGEWFRPRWSRPMPKPDLTAARAGGRRGDQGLRRPGRPGPARPAGAAGQPVALVGHNGSGKSTFLRLAAGLLDLTDGEIPIVGRAGRLVAGPGRGQLPARRARALRRPLRCASTSPTSPRCTASTVEAADLDELLERVGLAHRADDLPARFSRGLRQKASIVLGLVRPFEVLLDRRALRRPRRAGQDRPARDPRRAPRRRGGRRGRRPTTPAGRAGRSLRGPARRRVIHDGPATAAEVLHLVGA